MIGLAVADLETGEFAFHRRHKHFYRSIENFQYIPGADGGYGSREDITSGGPFFGLDDAAPAQSLQNLLEIVFGKVFGQSYGVDGKWLLGLGQSEHCPQAIVGFLGNFHDSESSKQ